MAARCRSRTLTHVARVSFAQWLIIALLTSFFFSLYFTAAVVKVQECSDSFHLA